MNALDGGLLQPLPPSYSNSADTLTLSVPEPVAAPEPIDPPGSGDLPQPASTFFPADPATFVFASSAPAILPSVAPGSLAPAAPSLPSVPPLPLAAVDLRLTGTRAADVLKGRAGDDRLNGGLGLDRLIGGQGEDRFVFSTKLGKANVDRIVDFHTGTDAILLAKAIFGDLAKGALAKQAFRLGLKALDGDDRILYDAKSGAVFYDADGSGTEHAAVKFAQLKAEATLKAADFLII